MVSHIHDNLNANDPHLKWGLPSCSCLTPIPKFYTKRGGCRTNQLLIY
jgi:hypothetical protein